MFPALIPILKMAAPYLISAIGSRIGAGAKHGASKDMQRKLMALLDPNALSGETNSLFDMLRASPMYSGLRNSAMQNSASLANNLNASFARRGLSNSGIAAVAEPLARSSYQNTFAGIDADLFTKALGMARQNSATRAGIIGDYGNVPSIGAGTMGGFMSDSLPSIYKLIEKYWGNKTSTGRFEGPTGTTPPIFPNYPARPRRPEPMF